MNDKDAKDRWISAGTTRMQGSRDDKVAKDRWISRGVVGWDVG